MGPPPYIPRPTLCFFFFLAQNPPIFPGGKPLSRTRVRWCHTFDVPSHPPPAIPETARDSLPRFVGSDAPPAKVFFPDETNPNPPRSIVRPNARPSEWASPVTWVFSAMFESIPTTSNLTFPLIIVLGAKRGNSAPLVRPTRAPPAGGPRRPASFETTGCLTGPFFCVGRPRVPLPPPHPTGAPPGHRDPSRRCGPAFLGTGAVVLAVSPVSPAGARPPRSAPLSPFMEKLHFAGPCCPGYRFPRAGRRWVPHLPSRLFEYLQRVPVFFPRIESSIGPPRTTPTMGPRNEISGLRVQRRCCPGTCTPASEPCFPPAFEGFFPYPTRGVVHLSKAGPMVDGGALRVPPPPISPPSHSRFRCAAIAHPPPPLFLQDLYPRVPILPTRYFSVLRFHIRRLAGKIPPSIPGPRGRPPPF